MIAAVAEPGRRNVAVEEAPMRSEAGLSAATLTGAGLASRSMTARTAADQLRSSAGEPGLN